MKLKIMKLVLSPELLQAYNPTLGGYTVEIQFYAKHQVITR